MSIIFVENLVSDDSILIFNYLHHSQLFLAKLTARSKEVRGDSLAGWTNKLSSAKIHIFVNSCKI